MKVAMGSPGLDMPITLKQTSDRRSARVAGAGAKWQCCRQSRG